MSVDKNLFSLKIITLFIVSVTLVFGLTWFVGAEGTEVVVAQGSTSPLILNFYLTPPAPTPIPTVIPDTTPPNTTFEIVEMIPSAHGWYRSAFIPIKFSATDDWVGVRAVYYRYNQSMPYDSPRRGTGDYSDQFAKVFISEEGMHQLEYYAVDGVGNAEIPHIFPINLDKTPPTVGHTINGNEVTLIGQDNLSGVDYYEINLNNSGWTTSGPSVTLPGVSTLAYRVVDRAGNISAAGNVIFDANILTAEAEDYQAKIDRNGQPWLTSTIRSGYVGSSYMIISPDRGVLYDAVTANGTASEMTYSFYVPTTGSYYLWLRGAGADAEGDEVYSVLVEENNPPFAPIVVTGFPPFRWGWGGKDLSGQPVTLTVTNVGTHTLYLWPREDGVSVDRILLTDNAGYIPTGLGP